MVNVVDWVHERVKEEDYKCPKCQKKIIYIGYQCGIVDEAGWYSRIVTKCEDKHLTYTTLADWGLGQK